MHCVLFLEIFSAHLFAPILETVRQMLGLEEEQVAEISGDNSKYEVMLISHLDLHVLFFYELSPYLRFLWLVTLAPFTNRLIHLIFRYILKALQEIRL